MARRNSAHLFLDGRLLDDQTLRQLSVKLARSGRYRDRQAARDGALGLIVRLWLIALTRADRSNRLDMTIEQLAALLGVEVRLLLSLPRWLRGEADGAVVLPNFWRKNEAARRAFYRRKSSDLGDKSGDSCAAPGSKRAQLDLKLFTVHDGEKPPPVQRVDESTAEPDEDLWIGFPQTPFPCKEIPHHSEHTPVPSDPRARPRDLKVLHDAERRRTGHYSLSDLQPFEVFLATYPTRAGALLREKTLAAIVYSIRNGQATWGEIIDGARRYRTYCDAMGYTGGRFVMSSLRFVDERAFREEWRATLETAARDPDDSASVERVRALLRDRGIT